VKRTLIIFVMLAATLVGCTRHRPDGNKSPFQEEDTRYTLAFVFDLGPKYRSRVLGSNPTALQYALEVKDIYFRDRSDASDRLLVAQVSSLERAVLWDAKPRFFKKEFPNPTKDFKDYLAKHADMSAGPHLYAYDAVADTFDYLLKFRSARGKTAVLVFSEMQDRSPDPLKARKHLVNSLAAYARSGGHCAFYWLSWDTCKEMEAVGQEAGLTWGHFIPDAVRDPVRPTFLD
jgi:hypothetical protein